jgi:hypothetical protein
MSDPQMTQITPMNISAEKVLNFGAQRLDYKHLVFDLRPSASSANNR